MKKIRFTPLIIVCIVLLFASLGVLGNWAYKTFLKDDDEQAGEMIVLQPIDSLVTANHTEVLMPASGKTQKKGSSKKTVEADNTLNPINTGVYHQTKKINDETAVEINKLKAEVAVLLKKNTGSPDLTLAQKQIEALEKRINKLVDKNSNAESENKRLFAVLRKLSDDKKKVTISASILCTGLLLVITIIALPRANTVKNQNIIVVTLILTN